MSDPQREQRLRDPDAFPTPLVLEKALGTPYPVLAEFLRTVESERFECSQEWRYYKDGKAWLRKIVRKKKTVAWISVWSGHFTVALYFTERTGAGIADLAVESALKKNYRAAAPIGRLKPLIAEVSKRSQLRDVYTLLEYKADTL